MGVIHQPHGINKKIKRVSRIVVLPDYQGIGIGTRFLTEIAKIYKNKGYDFSIVTSAKNMIKSLYKNDKWIMIRNSYCKCSSEKNDKMWFPFKFGGRKKENKVELHCSEDKSS